MDSSFIPLELSQYVEDDEIVNMTMGMGEKDLSWHNLQFSKVLHQLQNLQVHLFDQQMNQQHYYKNMVINK